jgi:hypothetical protein
LLLQDFSAHRSIIRQPHDNLSNVFRTCHRRHESNYLWINLSLTIVSGTWMLDKSRGEGLPPGMDQTMTVVHTGDKLSLETKLITPEGEQVVADSYMLDGKEAEFTPKTPGGQAGKGKRTAKWRLTATALR